MAAEEIKDALLVPGAVNVDTFADDAIEVAEVVLNEGSPAVGRSLSEVRLPPESLVVGVRSEEHTSELHSRQYLVCRLLFEKIACSATTAGSSPRSGPAAWVPRSRLDIRRGSPTWATRWPPC